MSKTTVSFDDWINENVEIEDIVSTWSVYHAVLGESDYSPFVAWKSKKGQLMVKNENGNNEILVIASEAAKKKFLDMLDDYYMDEGGVDAAKAIDDHNDTDDN